MRTAIAVVIVALALALFAGCAKKAPDNPASAGYQPPEGVTPTPEGAGEGAASGEQATTESGETPALETTEGASEEPAPSEEEPAKGKAAKQDKPKASDGKTVTTDSGLKYEDIVVGDGSEATPGATVSVHYVGTLKDGTKFDSSRDRGKPFSFTLGAGDVIRGWDEGVAGMKVGGKRKLTVPPDLGYGADGFPPAIPGNATLIFEVELLKVE